MERIRRFRTRREALDCLHIFDSDKAATMADATKSAIEEAIVEARVAWVEARFPQLRQLIYLDGDGIG